MISPSGHRTRGQAITDILRAGILGGDFAPGERMQEESLARALDVSRTPVREALRVLAKEGLLDYAANRGYRVRAFSTRDLMIAFRVRAALEGLGCRLIAEQGLPAEARARLERLLAAGDQLLDAQPFDSVQKAQWRDMNRDFHLELLHLADSALLSRIARDARALPIVNAGSFHWYRDEDFRRSHDQHHMVFRALCDGDGEQAEWWMKQHILHASKIVKDRMPG